LALEAAAKRAAELGLAPEVVEMPLAGEAVTAGASVADSLLNNCVRLSIPQPTKRPVCRIWGGETTVSLGDHPAGLGGRSQELALAAARSLSEARGVTLLAAGTDGRDGPTDAAGAIVDGTTWNAIAAAGRNPHHDLTGHDAYPALASVGALVKPGLTGTNVMDIVIGICGNDQG
jgi:glycerate 2-kinase